MKKLTSLFLSALLAIVTFTVSSCSKDDEPAPAAKPTVTVAAGEVTESTVSFTATVENATKVCYSFIKEGETAPTLASVLKDGKAIIDQSKPVTIDGLMPNTAYVVYVAAEGEGGQVLSQPLSLTTAKTKLTKAWVESYSFSYKDFIVNLSNDAYTLKLDFYSYFDGDAPLWLMPGTYTLGESKGKLDPISSKVILSDADETEKEIKEATVKVSLADNDAYTIDVDLVLADGESIVAVYEGEILNMKTFNLNLSDLAVEDVDDKTDGLFVLKGNDEAWTFDVKFWFYAAAGSKELPAGTYTLSDSKAANTLGMNTNFNVYSDERFSKYVDKTYSGTVVVAKNGSDYTFTINISNPAGYKYIGSYTGKIEGMNK